MAIYHFSAQVIKRSEGRSATNAAAYRAGEKIKDETLGQTFNYEKKDVAASFILSPPGSPEWVHDRSKLWNEVEKSETRINSQVAREINVALPIELSFEQQQELLKDFVQNTYVNNGMVADVNTHLDNPENPHAHIMLTMREISPNGFTEKNREWNKKQHLETWRESWQDFANSHLEKAGVQERIDHRSYEDQGLDILPQIHESASVRMMAKRGFKSESILHNEKVRERNQQLREANERLEQLDREMAEAQKEIASAISEKPELTKEEKIDNFIAKARKENAKLADPERSKKVLTYHQIKTQENEILSDIFKKEKRIERIDQNMSLKNLLFQDVKNISRDLENYRDSKSLFFKVFKRNEYKETQNNFKRRIGNVQDELQTIIEKTPEWKKEKTQLQQEIEKKNIERKALPKVQELGLAKERVKKNTFSKKQNKDRGMDR